MRTRTRKLLLLLAALCCLRPDVVHAAGRGEPGPVRAVRVDHVDRQAELKLLQEMDVDIDTVTRNWSRVYLVDEELRKLERAGLVLTILTREEVLGPPVAPSAIPPSQRVGIPASYHTYPTLTDELMAIAAANPAITRLISLGQSVQGRELWMMLITDHADSSAEEDEAELAYISSMHGDEVVGQELCIGLINHLVDNYEVDPRVTRLVDEAEIWIMPSMNPDGTALMQRYNAAGWDLNRSFPDQFVDATNTTDGRQPEVAAVMEWSAAHTIDLTANFHGGELVVNYPMDSNPAGTNTYSPAPAPDDLMYVSISRTYADNNPPMSLNNSHPAFHNGITNGADWYAINGGMQDWAYVWEGTQQVLVELSEDKRPAPSLLPQFWEDNLESMLALLERGLEGVRGIVTDAETGAPLPATIHIDANPFTTFSDPQVGDYHRLLLPGAYELSVSSAGYQSATVPVTVPGGDAVRYDVALTPLPTSLQPTSRRVIDADGYASPGESVDLAVTLRNLGRTATAVSGRLIPTGWHAGVDRAQASYADIVAGGSVESDAPHYAIEIDPAAPAGHKAGFAVEWSAEQGSGQSQPIFVEVGAPQCETTVSSQVPRTIGDHTTVTSGLTMTSAVGIDSIQVAVNLTHSYIGDLTVTLISPAGTRVVLHNRTGSSNHDIVGTYGADLSPAESLDLLAGEAVAGDWTLEVRDSAFGDTGFLLGWSLYACGRPREAAPPELRFRAFSRVGDDVRMDWWVYPGLDSYRVYRSTDPASAAAFVDVTDSDADPTDTSFVDAAAPGLACYLVTGVGADGEGPKGHFGQ